MIRRSHLEIWLALAAFAHSTPLMAAQVNWAQSFHDSGHTNFNNKETSLSTGNVGGLQPLWGQSVAGGVLGYALDKGTIYAQGQGSGAGADLEAIDAATGTHIWSITAGDDGIYLQGTVATDGGLVFSGCGFTDSVSHYGAMCAFKRSTGGLAWQFSAPCNCSPNARMVAPLVYSGGTVYFGYGNGGGSCGGDIEYIVAADAKTGTVRWTYTTGDCNSLSSTALVVADGHVYFETYYGSLVALSQTDGTFLWSVALCGGYSPTGLTAARGVVYDNVVCNGTGEASAFDGATGTQLWAVGIPGDQNFVVPPSLSKGVLYVTAGDHQIHALNAKTGATIWSGGPGTNSPASVANGVLYVDGGRDLGGAQPSATAYDASTGTELWETPAPGSTLNPGPMVANGTVYITNAQCGTVCAYTVPQGRGR